METTFSADIWYLCSNDQQVSLQVALRVFLRRHFEAERSAGSLYHAVAVHVAELVEVVLILRQVVLW